MRNKKKIISILLVVVLAFSFTTFAMAANDTYIQAHKGYCSSVASCEQGMKPMSMCCLNMNPVWTTAQMRCPVTGIVSNVPVLACRSCAHVFQMG